MNQQLIMHSLFRFRQQLFKHTIFWWRQQLVKHTLFRWKLKQRQPFRRQKITLLLPSGNVITHTLIDLEKNGSYHTLY